MIEATATPDAAPVDDNIQSIVDWVEKQDAKAPTESAPDDAEQADDPEAGDAEQAPATDGEEAPDVEATEAEDAAPELPATVKVKVNGEEREVSLDEALNGYSRNEDYKAKTAALAEKGRALESQYAETLQAVARQVELFDPVLAEAAQTDWAALSKDDPAGYVALQEAVKQRQSFLNAARSEASRVEQANLAETIRSETAALVAAIPQLADPATAQPYIADLTGWLKSTLKFDDDTINSVTDHRFYLLAEKARKFDAMQAAKAALPNKKVAPVSTVKTVKAAAEAPRATPKKPPPGTRGSSSLEWVLSQL